MAIGVTKVSSNEAATFVLDHRSELDLERDPALGHGRVHLLRFFDHEHDLRIRLRMLALGDFVEADADRSAIEKREGLLALQDRQSNELFEELERPFHRCHPQQDMTHFHDTEPIRGPR